MTALTIPTAHAGPPPGARRTLARCRRRAPYTLLRCMVGVLALGLMTAPYADTDLDPRGQSEEHGYFADIGWRTPAGVTNVLSAAERVLAEDPAAEIEILVHGKDMRLFIDGAQRRNPRIVAASEQLAASGRVRFRVCTHALSFKGKTLDSFPAHFGTVDYVPERVNELRAAGHQDLHAPP